MPLLSARLLGAPEVFAEGQPVHVGSAKARALLLYLLATRQVHSRDRLAGFFWPDVRERNALASLRTALYEIRRGLGDAGRSALFVERTRIALRGEVEVDIDKLEAIRPERDPSPEDDLAAIGAYRGEFLQGVSLPDSYDFDDWVFLERERLAHHYLAALCRQAGHFAAAGDLPRAIEMARRALAADPLREDVHRALMEYLARSGQRPAALAQYKTCVELLRRELAIEPLAETQELHRRILADETLPHSPTPTRPVDAPVARAAARRAAAPATPPVDPFRGVDPSAPVAPLVGRQAEVAVLMEAWAKVRAGGRELCLVVGEAGIGKTRLLGALMDAAADAIILPGRCFESASGQPYGAIVDAMRKAEPPIDLGALGLAPVWARELGRLLPELSPDLAEVNAPLDGLRDRDRLFEGVKACLAAMAAVRPVLVVVDDVQWSDATTLSLLAYLARAPELAPMLIVLACRPEELSSERRGIVRSLAALGRRVDLGPLTTAEAGRLVAAMSEAAEPPSRFAEALHSRTGGNPFFLIETVRALFAQGSLAAESGRWTTVGSIGPDYADLPVPTSVGLLVDSRLDALSDDAHMLVEAAAVLRRDFSFELVQSASAIPAAAALDGLDDLLTRGILVDVSDGRPGPARYDFAHALVRDRVYESLSGARRQYLHRQIAGRLESLDDAEPERVAYHYTRGGVRDRACEWSARAGRAAMDVYAAEDAILRFRSALELAVDAAEEHAARSGIGDALVLLGRPHEAIEAFEQALPSAPDVESRAELYRRIGRAHERQGSFDLALDAYARARQTLRGRTPSVAAARVADGLATVYVRLGRPAEAVALCRDALDWLDKHATVPDTDKAESWVRNTLGMALVHAGDFAGAVEHLERSLALKRQLRDRLGEATLRNNLGVVMYRQGHDEAARDHYAASLAIKEEIGDGYGRAIALTNLALMETHLGDHAAAAEHLAAAEQAAGDFHATWLVPEIRRVAAQRALAVGDTEAALSAAHGSLAAAEELGVPAFIGVAHRVLGQVKAAALQDTTASEEHFQTSLAVFEMLGDEHEGAKTHAAFAEVLAAHGAIDAADAHRRVAREVFERSGASGRLARLEGSRGQ